MPQLCWRQSAPILHEHMANWPPATLLLDDTYRWSISDPPGFVWPSGAATTSSGGLCILSLWRWERIHQSADGADGGAGNLCFFLKLIMMGLWWHYDGIMIQNPQFPSCFSNWIWITLWSCGACDDKTAWIAVNCPFWLDPTPMLPWTSPPKDCHRMLVKQ